MVLGMGIFREYFQDFKNQYVLIGGSACALLFAEAGIEFRATKDLDMVLIIEALTPEFGRRFWDFIQEGGYQNRNRSSGVPQYYRFDKPQNNEYPYMIELFSRTGSMLDVPDSITIPIHIDDDISSLSAILLNDEYYQILLSGKDAISDIIVLKPEFLIAFKAKAFLDIKTRRESDGLEINDEVMKHLKDILRLSTLLSGNEKLNLPETVKVDIASFISQYEREPYDPKQLGLPITAVEFIKLMRGVFML